MALRRMAYRHRGSDFFFGAAAGRAGTRHETMVRGSVRPSTFGIIDAFPDEAARERHLGGPVGKALAEKADELFASPPDISNLDVIANKL